MWGVYFHARGETLCNYTLLSEVFFYDCNCIIAIAVWRLSQPVLFWLKVLPSCNSLKHITEKLKFHLLAYDLQSKHYLKISAVKKKITPCIFFTFEYRLDWSRMRSGAINYIKNWWLFHNLIWSLLSRYGCHHQRCRGRETKATFSSRCLTVQNALVVTS